MGNLKKILYYAGLDKKDYEVIKSELVKSNVENMVILSKVAALFLGLLFILSFILPMLMKFRWYYGITMFVVIPVGLISKFAVLSDRAVVICMCIFMGALGAFGGLLGTIATPDEQAVTFVALVLTVPLLFVDRPIRMVCLIYLAVFIFILQVICFKDSRLIAMDIVHGLLFGTISAVISSYMMMVKCKKYLYEHEVAVLSEMDLLTDLYNRNAYEQRIKKHYPLCCRKSMCCIYADANGLHEINNTKGHEAGDRMLQFIARELKKQFGTRDVYRIGGDEFVVFVVDGELNEINRRLEDFRDCAEQNGYYISLGYEMQSHVSLDMISLIKSAEAKMYDDKAYYYQHICKKDSIQSGWRKTNLL